MFQKERDGIIQLQDGRDFGYSQIGDPKGKPIIFFHGWPGTRLDISCFHEEALKFGVKIISIDRPGCGLSSYQKKRKMSDLILDVIELLDHLKIAEISLIGFSTGVFYALEWSTLLSVRIRKQGPSNIVKISKIHFEIYSFN